MILISEGKVALKGQKTKGTQLNGKYNDIGSADENKLQYHCKAFI
jgi:hypothetical protein